jgi:CIC family chloride channel protein
MRDKETESLLNRFVIWRQQHISERQFVLILSLIVGVLTAFAAILLKSLIGEFHHLLTNSFEDTKQNYLFLLYPVITKKK